MYEAVSIRRLERTVLIHRIVQFLLCALLGPIGLLIAVVISRHED